MISTRLQKRAISIADYEHVMLTLFDAEVGDLLDLIVKKTFVEKLNSRAP